MISYDPFFKTLEEKHVSQYALLNKFCFSSGTLDRMRNNEPLNLRTIEYLCSVLNCPVEDIVNITPDPSLIKTP